MAVAEASLCRSARCLAGAGDGGAGEGSADWGRGRPVRTGLEREGCRRGQETPGPAAGLWEPPYPSPGWLITPCAPAPLVAASLQSSPFFSLGRTRCRAQLLLSQEGP